jgi:deoxyribonuclease V
MTETVRMKWPATVSTQEARELQDLLRSKVRIIPLKQEPRCVAGVDAAFSEDTVFAAACLYRYPELSLAEQKSVVRKLSFPYVPGYLSFREGPAVIAAIEQLSRRPDLLLVDGQGIAHPRGIGLASHIGVLTGIPSIGCAKSRLIGEHAEPGRKKGSWTPLRVDDVIVGAVLRTQDDTRPLFISPGHLTDLDTAVRLIIGCIGKYRIPEPLRCADAFSKKLKT